MSQRVPRSICRGLPADGGIAVRTCVPSVRIVSSAYWPWSSYRRRLGESSARGFIPKAELSGAELATLTS
jgi:hypothetical protein